MKNIILFTLLISSLNCAAQFTDTPPIAGSYTTNPYIDKFVGTWIAVGNSGQDTMRIVLSKQKVHFRPPFDYDVDMLVGWHSYKNAMGITIESNLAYVGNNFYVSHNSLFGATDAGAPDVVPFIFSDITKHKRGDAILTLQPGSLTIANWKLSEVRGLRSGSRGFSVPTILIFNKQ
jgi:hypothetical protein